MSDSNTTTEFNDTSVTNTEDITSTSPNSQENNSNSFLSEEEALSYLDSFNEDVEINNSVEVEDTNQAQMEVTGDELSIPDVDMEDFGITNVEPSNAQVEQNQNLSNQELLLAQILQKLDSKEQQPQQNSLVEDENLPMLNELATRLKTAGLLPNGLSPEDKELLNEVKAIKDEIEQQKQAQIAQAQLNSKIDAIDNFNKELESTIPNYNTSFMVSLVKKITDQNPHAGEQILNNPAMLISLWNKYGAVAVPQKPKTNAVLNSSNKANNITNTSALFDKVKSGTASEEEELRLISML